MKVKVQRNYNKYPDYKQQKNKQTNTKVTRYAIFLKNVLYICKKCFNISLQKIISYKKLNIYDKHIRRKTVLKYELSENERQGSRFIFDPQTRVPDPARYRVHT